MTPENEHLDEDQLLWERFRESLLPASAPSEVAANELAAWLDGTLAPQRVAAIEAAIAASRDEASSPQSILEIRQTLAAVSIAAEDAANDAVLSRIKRRAMLLDPAWAEQPRTDTRPHTPVLWVFPALRRGLAAAAVLGICVLGWQAGQSWATPPAPTMDAATLAAEMSFGVVDAYSDDSRWLAFELTSLSADITDIQGGQ